MDASKPLSASTEPMFSAIAKRYDFCNHLCSFGLDFYWRRKAADLCLRKTGTGTSEASAETCLSPLSALDLCCGTGDMTFALADTRQVKTITACDISLPMLECAKRKHDRKTARKVVSSNTSIEWLHRPAEDTGLADASYDLITCAFGLRNIDDISRGLKEMYRLLRPGGRICILEFFLPQNRILRVIYQAYLYWVMPLAARWIAGTPGPWHHLARSIEQWEKINLPEYLHKTGFCNITVHSLTFSTIHIITAQKEKC